MVLDHAGVTPNPARDRVQVKLPPDDTPEVNPPTAAHVEDALRFLAPEYRLPVLVLDATAVRVGEREGMEWRDVDEPRERWWVRKELNHSRRGRWVSPPPDVWFALMALVPREDRDPNARVLVAAEQAALRTAIGRACRAAGVPEWSPHDLRHRRISLWHRQGIDWARIGQWAGQKSLRTTADRYTHALLDEAEIVRGLPYA
jgi:integrase